MKTLYLGKWLYTANLAGETIEDFAMMTEDGKILWIKGQTDINIEPADQTVDLGEAYVVPGFIDCHLHFLGEPSRGGGEYTN